MNPSRVFILILVLLGFAVGGQADMLTLKDGDILTGEFVEISEGILTFRAYLVGIMMVPARQVQSLSTEHAVAVKLKDGRSIQGPLLAKNQKTHVTTQGKLLTVPINLEEVLRAAPAAMTENAIPSMEADTGGNNTASTVETGVLTWWGTADRTAPFTKLDVMHEAPGYVFYGDILAEVFGEGDFPRYIRSSFVLRPASSGWFRPEFGLDIERAIDEALDMRAEFSVGADRSFLSSERQTLNLGARISGIFEFYDAEHVLEEGELDVVRPYRLGNRPSERFVRERLRRLSALGFFTREDFRKDEQELALRLHLSYRRELFWNAAIEEYIGILPSLTKQGDILARSESSFELPLTEQIGLRLQVLVDFDSEPAFESLREWRTGVGASLHWRF
jgi:hypothetical protein